MPFLLMAIHLPSASSNLVANSSVQGISFGVSVMNLSNGVKNNVLLVGIKFFCSRFTAKLLKHLPLSTNIGRKSTFGQLKWNIASPNATINFPVFG